MIDEIKKTTLLKQHNIKTTDKRRILTLRKELFQKYGIFFNVTRNTKIKTIVKHNRLKSKYIEMYTLII